MLVTLPFSVFKFLRAVACGLGKCPETFLCLEPHHGAARPCACGWGPGSLAPPCRPSDGPEDGGAPASPAGARPATLDPLQALPADLRPLPLASEGAWPGRWSSPAHTQPAHAGEVWVRGAPTSSGDCGGRAEGGARVLWTDPVSAHSAPRATCGSHLISLPEGNAAALSLRPSELLWLGQASKRVPTTDLTPVSGFGYPGSAPRLQGGRAGCS